MANPQLNYWMGKTPLSLSGQPLSPSSSTSLFSYWPPRASNAPPPSLLPPRATIHLWPCPHCIENGHAGHLGALERATVHSCTVAAPANDLQPPRGSPVRPTMRVDVCDMPRLCPPPSFPSSRPSLHARRPPKSSNERPHTREALALPRSLSSFPLP